MTAKEIISVIEKTYQPSDLLYEKMFAHFANLSGFEFQAVNLKPNSPIVRARFSDSKKSFKYISDVSYPQKKHVKEFSRLNRPGQNLFYASESIDSCLTEMLPFWFDTFKTGDKITVTLGLWIVKSDIKLLIIPETENLTPLNTKVISEMKLHDIEFWDYISQKFKTSTSQDKDIYEFTSAFGNSLWLNAKKEKMNVDGFIYSSVQSKNNINIALDPQVVDSEKLVLTELMEIKFKRTGLNEKGLPVYRQIGKKKNGRINSVNKKIDWIKKTNCW